MLALLGGVVGRGLVDGDVDGRRAVLVSVRMAPVDGGVGVGVLGVGWSVGREGSVVVVVDDAAVLRR